MRVYNAIVLVDEPGEPSKHYATMVHDKVKQIETRMRDIIPEGDIVICCSNKSMTKYKGLALCIVHASKGRGMTKEDEPLARIEFVYGRMAFDLTHWRYFSRKFEFSKRYVSGSFQSIFQISIPDNITIL
jgi:hypothetical protein